jgi:Holliday junction DNA helicase RuvA
MIATLTGMIAEKTADIVVLDVAGVGYGIFVTSEDHGRLPTGQQAKLYIYEHIRENTYDIFGFILMDTKRLFELLLSVNGIGPRTALNMLSIGAASEVRQAIAGGDVKFIQATQGVGKRVAERVVVELKDKVGLEGVDLSTTGLLQSDTRLLGDEAVEALVSLGFSPQDAAKALQGVDETLPIGERVKMALKVGRS